MRVERSLPMIKRGSTLTLRELVTADGCPTVRNSLGLV